MIHFMNQKVSFEKTFANRIYFIFFIIKTFLNGFNFWDLI